MSAEPSKYRFLLINAFSLPPGGDFKLRAFDGPKEQQLYNYEDVKPFLEGIDWDLHPGAAATHGNWPVQSKWEFLSVGYNRQAVVREACESGKYNAIVLLGGGDPGYLESREIGRQHRIPVTSCAHAQMHMAGLLGHKFSVVDIGETHNMQMVQLVVQYRMTERCASIRNINYPLPSPNFPNDKPIDVERDRALNGAASGMLDAAVTESVAAIEEDGAEVTPIFDRQLGKNRFLAGDTLTAADLYLFPLYAYFSDIAELKAIADKAPNINRWAREMAARPSAQATEPTFKPQIAA